MPSPAVDPDDALPLAQAIEAKLSRWARAGMAQEYHAISKRGPIKEQVNHQLNRFGGGMGPYRDSLLPLKSVEYINASPIDILPSGHRFVATMCPKRATFAHFWAMVWEMGSPLVVNLTHEEDTVGSGPSDKRERYWPPLDAHNAPKPGAAPWPVVPELVGAEHCPIVPGLSRYHLTLVHHSGERRPLVLLWYARWIDFADSHMIGTGAFHRNAAHVLALAYAVRAAGREALVSWPVVHCSAGVGRTGTFIALLEALERLGAVGHDVSALDALSTSTIEAMRERRLWMVKSDFEFATMYAAIALHLRGSVRGDVVVDGWRPGDYEEVVAAAGSQRRSSLDICGRKNDPMKTPEAYYAASQRMD